MIQRIDIKLNFRSWHCIKLIKIQITIRKTNKDLLIFYIDLLYSYSFLLSYGFLLKSDFNLVGEDADRN